jgi:hypothetical protein
VLLNPLARDTPLVATLLVLPPICLRVATWASLCLELAFFPLGVFYHTRCVFWFTMLGLHLGMLFLVDFADLTLGVLVMHAFLFDVRWVAAPIAKVQARFNTCMANA